MAYEMQDKKGALFPNVEKEHEKQPDWTGKVKINGKEWRLAAWMTTSRSGDEYMSLAVSDPADFKRSEPSAGRGRTYDHGGNRRPGRALSDEEFQRRRKEIGAATREMEFPDDDIPF